MGDKNEVNKLFQLIIFVQISMFMLKTLPKVKYSDSQNFFLLAGPCAIEGEEMAFQIAERIYQITSRLEIPWIFKGS